MDSRSAHLEIVSYSYRNKAVFKIKLKIIHLERIFFKCNKAFKAIIIQLKINLKKKQKTTTKK